MWTHVNIQEYYFDCHSHTYVILLGYERKLLRYQTPNEQQKKAFKLVSRDRQVKKGVVVLNLHDAIESGKVCVIETFQIVGSDFSFLQQ